VAKLRMAHINFPTSESYSTYLHIRPDRNLYSEGARASSDHWSGIRNDKTLAR